MSDIIKPSLIYSNLLVTVNQKLINIDVFDAGERPLTLNISVLVRHCYSVHILQHPCQSLVHHIQCSITLFIPHVAYA